MTSSDATSIFAHEKGRQKKEDECWKEDWTDIRVETPKPNLVAPEAENG